MAKNKNTVTISGEVFNSGPIDLDNVRRAAARLQQSLPGTEPSEEYDLDADDDERIELEDARWKERLNASELAWMRGAKKHLDELAWSELGRRTSKSKIQTEVVWRHRGEQLASGKITITIQPRRRYLDEAHAQSYLAELANWKGIPAGLVSQVCHDLHCLLRPSSIKVSLSTKILGLARTEEDERTWAR